MVDVLLDLKTPGELLASAEQPRHTVLVTLPMVEINNDEDTSRKGAIKLAMHTDNLQILLRTLSTLPQLPLLKIEGRVISYQQIEELKQHPVYRFYMEGRIQRATISNRADAFVYLLPRNLRLDPLEAASFLELPFSPSTLSSDLGFKTGYYSAEHLVMRWKNGQATVNDFLPQFGGINEFSVGSEVLSLQELGEVASRISEAIQSAQGGLLSTASVSLNSLISMSQASSYQPLIISTFSPDRYLKFINTNMETKNLNEKINNDSKFFRDYKINENNNFKEKKSKFDKNF